MSQYSLENTFWNDRRSEDRDRLNEDIPVMGEIEDENRKALEHFRNFQNAYYDLYNNGFGNFADDAIGAIKGDRYEKFVSAVHSVGEMLPNALKHFVEDTARSWDNDRNYPSLFSDNYWTQAAVDQMERIGDKLIDAALEELNNLGRVKCLTERLAEMHIRPSDRDEFNAVITALTDVGGLLADIAKQTGDSRANEARALMGLERVT